jgi:hypothetical protein
VVEVGVSGIFRNFAKSMICELTDAPAKMKGFALMSDLLSILPPQVDSPKFTFVFLIGNFSRNATIIPKKLP